MINRFYLGVFFIILSATGFGVMPILAKYAYAGGANVSTLLFLRFGLASLFFFLYLGMKKDRTLLSITKRQWFALIVYGGLTYAMLSTLYFSSLHYISGSLATLLFYTSPIFVVLLTLWLDKKMISCKVGIAIVLSILGLGLVLGTSVYSINYFGVILAIVSGIAYSVHVVLMNRMVKQLPPFLTTAFVILFTTISLFVIGLATNTLRLQFDSEAWVSIIGLSFCSTILALLTFFLGLHLIGSTNASVLSMLEPVITIILSALILGESFTFIQFVGTAIVLAAAVMVVYGQDKSHSLKPNVSKTS